MDHSVHRYDFAPIKGHEVTDEGFLRVWCRAARSGTQLYRRADGSQVREYRPPEEVGNPDSLTTFGMKPVTWTHPPELLTSENTKRFQVGYSGSQVRYNDGFVEVALMVTDKDAIEKIKRGDATEVSAGYKVDFDPTPGITPEGQSYDGVQRNVRVNHIAVVPRGRAGPEVRLLLDRMDTADAVSAPSEETAFLSVLSPTESPMATVKLDGLEIDLPIEVASAVQSYVRDSERRADSINSERDALKARVDSLEADLQTITEAKEAAEGRADALEYQLEEAPRFDQKEIDALVIDRLNTLQHLAPAFAEDFKFDGISTDELYVSAYTNLKGSAPREDADPAYVRGLVDGVLEHMDAKSKAAEEEDPNEEEPDGDADDAQTPEDRKNESKGMKAFMAKKKAKKDAPEDMPTARGDSTIALREALGQTQRTAANPSTIYRAKQAEAWKQPLSATKGVR